MARQAAWVAFVLVLMGLGYIIVKPGSMFESKRQAEPSAAAPPSVAASPSAPAPPVVVSPAVAEASVSEPTYGLSFALSKSPSSASKLVHLTCHGEPAPLDRPHRNSCNPYQGDTSCRSVLPIACFKATGVKAPPNLEQDFYKGWTSGQLGATRPILGATLKSEADASARCQTELGPNWRMAEFHDGGGWGLQGEQGPGIQSVTRYWVYINDQPGNCWNKPRAAPQPR